MGQDQNNAGIHMIPRSYKWKTDNVDSFDRYASLIVSEKHNKLKKNCLPKNQVEKMELNEVIKDIEICNFIMLTNQRGKKKVCLCGGNLRYQDGLVVRFHNKGVMDFVTLSGKLCVDCGRKLIITHELLEKMNEEKKFRYV